MPFDVVSVLPHDWRRVLLEQQKLQDGTRDPDLFRNRFPAPSATAMEQISSWLRGLSELFAFFPRQACARDFCVVPCCGSIRDSVVLFSFPKAAIAILQFAKYSRTGRA